MSPGCWSTEGKSGKTKITKKAEQKSNKIKKGGLPKPWRASGYHRGEASR